MGRVDDLVVVITGAAGGQGAAHAAALAAEGARVIATDVNEPKEPLPDGVVFRTLDVADEEHWRNAASGLADTYGRVDALVNNAGMPWAAGIEEMELTDWNRVFAVNVTGAMLGMKHLVPLMKNGGSIVNVSSLAGLLGAQLPAYTASKWALRGLSRSAGHELGPKKIRVNTVFPGFIDTPMVAFLGQPMRDASVRNVPLGRLGTVDDVSPLVVFLVSPESSWISGAEISVDGGEWSHGGNKRLADELSTAGILG
ncbi:SDR family NAD(P)-dependent oxidoreductase [Streptomyces sp. A30]|uniref:SDR family NAD(P)-dependent oxidoreductase n=1 Tax=Streptomyces sp. A30 TaxID=2789273 RepID=UPI00397F1658